MQYIKERGRQNACTIALFLGACKQTIVLVMFALSVRPHGTTLLQLDGFSWNLILQYYSEICRENSSFIKIWK